MTIIFPICLRLGHMETVHRKHTGSARQRWRMGRVASFPPVQGTSSLDCHDTGGGRNQGNKQTEIHRSLLLTGRKREVDPPHSSQSSMTRLDVWFAAGSVNTLRLWLFLLIQHKSYLNKQTTSQCLRLINTYFCKHYLRPTLQCMAWGWEGAIIFLAWLSW